MQAAPLSLSDLRVVSEEEPRLQDLKIAAALGFERPRNIRNLIERNMAELTRFGVCYTVRQTSGPAGGRPGKEYWLNEEQALLVSTLSDAPHAAEVRHMLIKVFVAWRKGQLQPTPVSYHENVAPDAFAAMAERLASIEAAVGFRSRTADASLAASVTHLPIWKTGRRPKWWSDVEVRTLLTSTHRQTTIQEICILLFERFGPDRTPSRSSVARYWLLLDLVHGTSPSKRRK